MQTPVSRSSTVGTIPASILQQGNAAAAAKANGRANTGTGDRKMVTYSTTELNTVPRKPLKVSSSLKSIMVNTGTIRQIPSFSNHKEISLFLIQR